MKLKALTVSIILGVSTLSANVTIEKIKMLPIVKNHKFVPVELKDGGSLVLVKGYFQTGRGVQNASMFITHDMKTIVYGRGFNTSTSKEYKSFTMNEIKSAAGLVYGKGKDEFILVVDPLCPFCKDIEKNLHKYENDITVYVIFMPLMRLHPTAKKAISYIISKKTEAEKFKALQSIANGNKDFEKITIIPDEIEKSIKLQEEKAGLLGADRTPSLYLGSGQQVKVEILNSRYGKKKTQKKK